MVIGCSSKIKNCSLVFFKLWLCGWVYIVMVLLILFVGVGFMIVMLIWGNWFVVGVWMFIGLELFGNLVVYYWVLWGVKVKDVLWCIDYVNIVVFIVGMYILLVVFLVIGVFWVILLVIIWVCVLFGVVFWFVWNGVFWWVLMIFYVVMGWIVLWWFF